MANILVVEPDDSLGETLDLYLGRNFDVQLARDAQSAITKADKKRPDLVILELAMAKNNGVAFMQEFRSYTDWQNIPIIVYTRIPREDTGQHSTDWEKQGVIAYLYKPVTSLASLSHHIQNSLNNYETA